VVKNDHLKMRSNMPQLLRCVGLLGALVASSVFANNELLPAAEPSLKSNTDCGIHVAKFKADREAAISFTVDDGREDAATVGVPLFDRYGFHASFFLIVGGIPDAAGKSRVFSIPWSRWLEISRSGHEIGNHTLNHGISKDSDEQARKDIDDARQIIADKIGTAPVSFVYPGNHRDDRVRKFVYAHHAVAREFETLYGKNNGVDFTVEKANSHVDKALADKAWMVPMLHGIVEDNVKAPFAIRPEVLEGNLRYLQTLKGRIWVDTFGNVGRYVKERAAAALTAKREGDHAVFTLTTGLDASLFSVPLTVVIDKVKARSVLAKREVSAVPLASVIEGDRILVDVVPGPGAVTVTWK
jgi:peptidoglycan/xylan/chitin deacetylase (PgdA/CDA1 family)